MSDLGISAAALWQENGAQWQQGAQSVAGEGEIWLCVAGQIDIFFCVDSTAQREHWCTLEAGQVFLFPPNREVQVLAFASADAQYWRLPHAALARLWQQVEGRTISQPLLQLWHSRLLLGDEAEAVADAPPSIWLTSDGVQLLGQLLVGLVQAWQDWLIRQQQNELEELDRLRRKGEIGRQTMAQALGGLVATFDESDALDNLSGDVLLAACQALGKVTGIEFKMAANIIEGRSQRNLINDIAQASNVRARMVALRGDWWLRDNGPLLAFVAKIREPLALIPQAGGGYQVYDPIRKQHRPLTTEQALNLAPLGYMFYRSLPSHPLAWQDIARFALFGMQRELSLLGVIGLVSAVLGMAIPVASGHLFDNVFPAADQGQVTQVVLILFIASVVNLLFEATRAMLLLRVEGRASADLQAAVWDRVLKLPATFFRDYAAGDLANRINGINEIRQALAGNVVSSLLAGIFSLLNIVLMFYYSVKLALLALALVLLMVVVNLVLAYFNVGITRAATELNGAVAATVQEYLSGVAKLRVTGAEPRAFANWALKFGQQKRLSLRAGRLANVSNVFGVLFPLLANTAIFALMAFNLVEKDGNRFSTGDFIAFSASFSLFLNGMLNLAKTGTSLINIVPTYQRTQPILQATPEVDGSKADPGSLQGAIEIANLSFAYAPDSPKVLDDISLTIKPGEFVALVGASGSGKSTLLRLLLGFERPSQGDIYYDNHNLKEIDVGALRRQLGVVLQGGRLMTGDVYSNIVGSTSLALEDAWVAIRSAGLEKDIEAMPMGIHTIVSDGGGTLSGGQRQRLLIARAIVHKPNVIFFDEATSALDNQTQAIVSSSLEALKATRIVIAHRLSTVMEADCIYVLDQGRIVQAGRYQELMQQEGLFADMAKRQLI